MKDRVSVIVVTYNRPKDVREAVESLLNQSVKPFEVIVIDDGSNPPSSTKFLTENLKVIRFDQEVGLVNARNYGVNIAKGECIAFIDDDAVAEKNWVKEIQKGLESADVIGGPIKPLYQALPPEWWNEKMFGAYAGVGNAGAGRLGQGLEQRARWIWGCNMAFRTEVFKTIGLFNPNLGRRKGKLFNSEEADLIERARGKGFNIQFMQAAVVYHKVPPQRMTIDYVTRWGYGEGKSLRVWKGYHPLKECFNLLWCIFTMADFRFIVSEKSVRIKKIAWMAELLGRIF